MQADTCINSTKILTFAGSVYGIVGISGVAFWLEDEEYIWQSQNCVALRREGSKEICKRTELIVKNMKIVNNSVISVCL